MRTVFFPSQNISIQPFCRKETCFFYFSFIQLDLYDLSVKKSRVTKELHCFCEFCESHFAALRFPSRLLFLVLLLCECETRPVKNFTACCLTTCSDRRRFCVSRCGVASRSHTHRHAQSHASLSGGERQIKESQRLPP